MQNNVKGLALLITLVSTAFYAYCCFLGLNFCLDGKIAISAICVVVLLMVLAYALHALVKSKTHRNAREGKRVELKAAGIVVIVIALACPFFSKFIEMHDYSRHGILSSKVSETIDTVRVIDSCYIAYADQRVKKLRRISKIYGNSLSRRLKPADLDSVVHERREWLDNLSAPNIWNIFTARNISHLTSAGNRWVEEYASMSAMVYRGESKETQPFSHPASASVDEFKHTVNALHMPDWRGIMGSLLCLCIMLTNYFVTRRVKTGS